MNFLRVRKATNILIFWLVLSQNSVTAQESIKEWQAPYLQEHTLVGKVWDTHKDDWLSENQFYYELTNYDYILLGEVHNHPDHHILQAEVLDALANLGINPSVVMEMLTIESWKDQPLTWEKTDELQELASMLNDGWPWELYKPVLSSIVRHGLNLYAGNISGEELQNRAYENSLFDYSYAEKNYSYTKENFETLKKDIIDSHCGYANEGLVKFMSRAQMQRDHIMVSALLDKKQPVVFIAGKGHVRNDYAVPMQLRRNFKQTSYLSVAYIPVREGIEDPQEYLQDSHDLYDILYFTPSHTTEDPCVKFQKQLQNMRQRQDQ